MVEQIVSNNPESDELWGQFGSYELYEASTHGQIRSWNSRGRRRKKPIIIRQVPKDTGYMTVKLSLNGKTTTKQVSHLVAQAFIGPRPEGMYVCHNDGNPLNNRADNLRYDTPKGNMGDRARHGTHVRGKDIYGARLDEDAVRSIRAFLKEGWTQRFIAKLFGVTFQTVNDISRKKVWSWVE
jgi:hypothetical protein